MLSLRRQGHRVSRGGRARHRLLGGHALTPKPTPIRGASSGMPQLFRLPRTDQDDHRPDRDHRTRRPDSGGEGGPHRAVPALAIRVAGPVAGLAREAGAHRRMAWGLDQGSRRSERRFFLDRVPGIDVEQRRGYQRESLGTRDVEPECARKLIVEQRDGSRHGGDHRGPDAGRDDGLMGADAPRPCEPLFGHRHHLVEDRAGSGDPSTNDRAT